jgi:heat shock protein HslJ
MHPLRPLFLAVMVTACAKAEPPGPLPAGLAGTDWTAKTVAGEPVPKDVAVTIQFADAGRISGRSGCNRYAGEVRVVGDTLEIGPLASTRMACPPPQMAVETAFLQALEAAERFARDNMALVLHSAGGIAPSRFLPFTPP